MANAILSKQMAATANMERNTMKYYADITGVRNDHVYYYLKPSVKSRLVGITMKIYVAGGTTYQTAPAVTKETAVPSSSVPFDVITKSLAAELGTVVANDTLMASTTAENALATLAFIPGANFGDAVATFDPAAGDAVIIDLHHGDNATLVKALLEIEFLPVI